MIDTVIGRDGKPTDIKVGVTVHKSGTDPCNRVTVEWIGQNVNQVLLGGVHPEYPGEQNQYASPGSYVVYSDYSWSEGFDLVTQVEDTSHEGTQADDGHANPAFDPPLNKEQP